MSNPGDDFSHCGKPIFPQPTEEELRMRIQPPTRNAEGLVCAHVEPNIVEHLQEQRRLYLTLWNADEGQAGGSASDDDDDENNDEYYDDENDDEGVKGDEEHGLESGLERVGIEGSADGLGEDESGNDGSRDDEGAGDGNDGQDEEAQEWGSSQSDGQGKKAAAAKGEGQALD